MAVLTDQSLEPVVHPAKDLERIRPYLEACKELLVRCSDEAVELETLIPANEPGASQSEDAGSRPGFVTVIGLFDRGGKRQGSLIAMDSNPRPLNDEQKNAIARIAKVTERHIEAGAIEDLNQRLKAQDTEVELLSEVVRQINNGVVVTDERGIVTWINHGFEKFRATGSMRCSAKNRAPCCRGN